ncbi:MAG: metal-dependent hydrolase [Saprospiraceae bacterium]|jgi:L-ascorbate metabolism protein UlaG (beta-lactamase superfamily)|nr:metal-dependent hydrolase [Saprospiraceae bacterium]
MKLIYFGHSSFQVLMQGKSILIDPFLSGNELAKDIVDVDTIEADYILLSHAHQDHSLDVERIAKRTGAVIIGVWEIYDHYTQKGLKAHPMNIGGKWEFEFGTVKMVNAVHSSSFPDGKYGGVVGGFVVWNDDVCFYYAGDTALTLDMQLIPMTCHPLDFAILPIGDNFTMGYDDALIASDFIQCDRIVGCHYDTFPYVKIDHEAAINAFKTENKELILLDPGKSIELSNES